MGVENISNFATQLDVSSAYLFTMKSMARTASVHILHEIPSMPQGLVALYKRWILVAKCGSKAYDTMHVRPNVIELKHHRRNQFVFLTFQRDLFTNILI